MNLQAEREFTMKKKLSGVVIFAFWIAPLFSFAQESQVDSQRMIKVILSTETEVSFMTTLGALALDDEIELGENLFIANDSLVQEIETAGIPVEMIVANIEERVDAERDRILSIYGTPTNV